MPGTWEFLGAQELLHVSLRLCVYMGVLLLPPLEFG